MNYDFWYDVGNWGFYATAAVSLLFTVMYCLLSPFWRTETGRNIAALMAVIAAITTWSSATLWTSEPTNIPAGDRPITFYQVRAILMWALAAVIFWRVVIFIRVQLLARRERKEKERHDLRT